MRKPICEKNFCPLQLWFWSDFSMPRFHEKNNEAFARSKTDIIGNGSQRDVTVFAYDTGFFSWYRVVENYRFFSNRLRSCQARKYERKWHKLQIFWKVVFGYSTKGGFFSESVIRFLNLEISKKINIPKDYPELTN